MIEDDLYSDLPVFQFDEDLAKLQESNKVATEKASTLSGKVKELSEENSKLKVLNETLSVNISILLKTAKAEIQRKDRIINDLRRQHDDLVFRRNQHHQPVENYSYNDVPHTNGIYKNAQLETNEGRKLDSIKQSKISEDDKIKCKSKDENAGKTEEAKDHERCTKSLASERDHSRFRRHHSSGDHVPSRSSNKDSRSSRSRHRSRSRTRSSYPYRSDSGHNPEDRRMRSSRRLRERRERDEPKREHWTRSKECKDVENSKESKHSRESSKERESKYTKESSKEKESKYTKSSSKEKESKHTKESSKEKETKYTKESCNEKETKRGMESSKEKDSCKESPKEKESRHYKESSKEKEPKHYKEPFKEKDSRKSRKEFQSSSSTRDRDKSCGTKSSSNEKSSLKEEERIPVTVESDKPPCIGEEVKKKSKGNGLLKRLTSEPVVEHESKEKSTPVTIRKIKVDDYLNRKMSENKRNSRKESEKQVVFDTVSPLEGLYEAPIQRKKTESLYPVVDENQGKGSVEENIEDSLSGGEDWALSFKNERPVQARTKTLYTRRMERRILQEQEEREAELIQKLLDIDKESEQEEKEEKEKREQQQQQLIQQQQQQQQHEHEEKEHQGKPESEDELLQKLNEIERESSPKPREVVEFSPFKNNYKLIKMSPMKPATKQHILDFYKTKFADKSIKVQKEVESTIFDLLSSLSGIPLSKDDFSRECLTENSLLQYFGTPEKVNVFSELENDILYFDQNKAHENRIGDLKGVEDVKVQIFSESFHLKSKEVENLTPEIRKSVSPAKAEIETVVLPSPEKIVDAERADEYKSKKRKRDSEGPTTETPKRSKKVEDITKFEFFKATCDTSGPTSLTDSEIESSRVQETSEEKQECIESELEDGEIRNDETKESEAEVRLEKCHTGTEDVRVEAEVELEEGELGNDEEIEEVAEEEEAEEEAVAEEEGSLSDDDSSDDSSSECSDTDASDFVDLL